MMVIFQIKALHWVHNEPKDWHIHTHIVVSRKGSLEKWTRKIAHIYSGKKSEHGQVKRKKTTVDRKEFNRTIAVILHLLGCT